MSRIAINFVKQTDRLVSQEVETVCAVHKVGGVPVAQGEWLPWHLEGPSSGTCQVCS